MATEIQSVKSQIYFYRNFQRNRNMICKFRLKTLMIFALTESLRETIVNIAQFLHFLDGKPQEDIDLGK